MIHFTKEPYSQDALHGRSAILRCEVEDPADVEFEWLQNGLPVRDTEQRFKEGSNLQFAAVDRHRDAGDFQCVARNLLTGEEARTTNASFNIKCECGERAARHAPQPGAAHRGRGKALSRKGLRLETALLGHLLTRLGAVVRGGSDGMNCASRIPPQLPCPSCPLGCLYLLMSPRLPEMLSPATFPICIYETGMLLHQVCPEHCRSFQSPSYPSENSYTGQRGVFAGWVSLSSVLASLLPALVITESASAWAL